MMESIVWTSVIISSVAYLFVFLLFCVLFLRTRVLKKSQTKNVSQNTNGPVRIGILHPDAFGGGGGERVLWILIQTLDKFYHQNNHQRVRIIVFVKSENNQFLHSFDSVRSKLESQFGLNLSISLERSVRFEYLRLCPVLEPNQYPVCTLLLQFLGGALVALEIASLYSSQLDIFIDTTGHAASLFIMKWIAQCKTAAYIHYPTISTDMLHVVRRRQTQFNNSSKISNSVVFSQLKLGYYSVFAALYSVAGRCADIVIVNSSWTQAHIKSLWKAVQSPIHIAYPPVETEVLKSFPINGRSPALIVSLAQFRPEKNHRLQLEAFAFMLQKYSSQSRLVQNARLLIIGSCRGDAQSRILDELTQFAVEQLHLKVPEQVEFLPNKSHLEVLQLLADASIGIHTMKDEHFGISVVEMQAAGLITIAHNSGGVKLDIIQHNKSGFLADTKDEYAERLAHSILMNESDRDSMIGNARRNADRFSHSMFESSIIDALSPIL